MRGVNVNMFYDDLNTEEQVSYLIKPILQVLQEAGGQLERSEIRDRISELDEHIAEFEQKLYTSNKTGNQYKKFDFKFNFAIKELSYVGLISYVKFNPKITLTQDGANVDLTDFDVKYLLIYILIINSRNTSPCKSSAFCCCKVLDCMK